MTSVSRLPRLENKIAIVTGGAQGMGAATVRLFAAEGATVIVADILEDAGRGLAGEIGDKAHFSKLDVTRDEQWRALVGDTVRRFGRIDALVNNAGALDFATIDAFTEEQFERIFAVNVKGPLLGMKHVGAVMVRQRTGSIVNVSSVDGLRGANALSVYSASKWAIRGATRTAALELGPYKVRVNSVHPGGIDTRMGNPAGLQGAERNRSYGRVPLQRIGEPHEVARASLFLCSDEASYITGAELVVDGGWAAGYYHAELPGMPPAVAPAR